MAEKLTSSTQAKSQIEDLISECIPGGSVCDPQAVADNIRRYCNAWPDPVQAEVRGDEPVAPFQARVQPWMLACFGAEIAGDKLERGDRLLEEVLELLQSGYYPPARVAALTAYVYGRPVGEPSQEVGGVMVTLAAYCLAHEMDMHEAAEVELARIWTKVESIRAKQAAKPTGSALPVAIAASAAPQVGEAERLAAPAKRNILDAIRDAYDLGYNDARNAKAVPGDSAPGYHGRDAETDHGGALFNTLQRRWLASQPMSRERLTGPQIERLYENIPPSRQQDARSREAFKRIVGLVESVHQIGSGKREA